MNLWEFLAPPSIVPDDRMIVPGSLAVFWKHLEMVTVTCTTLCEHTQWCKLLMEIILKRTQASGWNSVTRNWKSSRKMTSKSDLCKLSVLPTYLLEITGDQMTTWHDVTHNSLCTKLKKFLVTFYGSLPPWRALRCWYPGCPMAYTTSCFVTCT